MFIDAIKSVLSVNRSISREEAAVLLKTTPEALDAFEDAYQARVFEGDGSDNLFDVNAADIRRNMKEDREVLNTETIHKKDEIVSRIIKELLAQTDRFARLPYPILVGLSRKSSLGAITGRDVNHRSYASVAGALIAAQKGASIVRVHDVAATVDAFKIWLKTESSR